jgi:photosystem II stability/assembly factor-like uncharacterized protein
MIRDKSHQIFSLCQLIENLTCILQINIPFLHFKPHFKLFPILTMKLIFIFLLTFVSNFVYSQSAWHWINPYPTGNSIMDIKYLSNEEICVIGERGLIYKSTNGGSNWTDKSRNIPQSFEKIFFLNNSTGYVLTTNGILFKTINSGEIWDQVVTGIVTDETYSIEFTNEQTGYIASAWGKIYKTTNGGGNWIVQNTNTIYFWKASHFINSLTGFCIGANKIARTTNGGSNWMVEDVSLNATLRTIAFLNDNTGFVAGEGGKVFKTTNLGINWDPLQTNFYSDINKLTLIDSNTYIAVTDSGKIYKTSDSGNNWTLKLMLPYGKFLSVDNYNNSVIAVGIKSGYYSGMNYGEALVYKSTDQGNEWISLGYNENNSNNYSIDFINELTGFIVGDSGKVLKTSNGGNTWNEITFPSNEPLSKIYFRSEITGYIIARYINKIYRSTDSGNNWIQYFPVSNPEFRINSINFRNDLTGFISGYNLSDESIYRSTDGGVTWNPVGIGYSQTSIVSIDFMNEQTGFAAGSNSNFNGALFRSTNGGLNWSFYSNFNYYLGKIKFVNDSTGYLIHGGSRLLKTSNRGNYWYEITSSQVNSIYDFDFISQDSGYIVGWGGAILRTFNGGLQWSTQNVTNVTPQSIKFINNRTGFIVGSTGMILKTNSFGINVGINLLSNNIPTDFYLNQNYPNPFNPITNINFGLNKSGHTILRIYDINGRQVEILKNEYMQPGNYSIKWNALGYSSGIYFYSIQFENKVQTRKMLLIK